jgi:hypothetical protein
MNEYEHEQNQKKLAIQTLLVNLSAETQNTILSELSLLPESGFRKTYLGAALEVVIPISPIICGCGGKMTETQELKRLHFVRKANQFDVVVPTNGMIEFTSTETYTPQRAAELAFMLTANNVNCIEPYTITIVNA